MVYFWYAFLFFIGAAIGSFLNVLAVRYDPGKKILTRDIFLGRSHCVHCGKVLRWYELFPIFSYLIQRGKCLSCGASLSFQYFVAELIAGAILVFFTWHFYKFFNLADIISQGGNIGPYYIFLCVWILVAYGLLLMSLIDFRLKIIPDQINVFLLVLVAALVALKYFYSFTNTSFLGKYSLLFNISAQPLLSHFLAAIFGLFLFGLIVVLSRGRGMGIGDVKLAGALGLLLGLPDIVFSFFSSFIIGAIVGVFLLLLGKKSLKDAVPFGPFLALGVFLTIFWGENLLDYYFSLFQFLTY